MTQFVTMFDGFFGFFNGWQALINSMYLFMSVRFVSFVVAPVGLMMSNVFVWNCLFCRRRFLDPHMICVDMANCVQYATNGDVKNGKHIGHQFDTFIFLKMCECWLDPHVLFLCGWGNQGYSSINRRQIYQNLNVTPRFDSLIFWGGDSATYVVLLEDGPSTNYIFIIGNEYSTYIYIYIYMCVCM